MRSHRLVGLVVALAFGLLVGACGSGESSGGGATASADSSSADGDAVDFTAATLDGGELAAGSLEGSDTVLWFWAPWCTICRAEAPDVVAAADAFEGEVEIIGVAGRGSVSEMEAFVDDTETGALTHVVDADGTVWSSFEVFAQPAFAFVDDSGEVEVFVGTLGEQALTERMDDLLAA